MINQPNTSISSYNYLYEISAIPKEIRVKYYYKLLRRKNAGSQKNIKLLQIIYRLIDNNYFSGWNADSVCKKLNVSVNELYYLKSILLKGIREYYLNWALYKKTVEIKQSNPISKYEVLWNEVNKMRKMTEIGMYNEAKNLGLKIKDELIPGTIEEESKILLLSEIYENIIIYYFNQRKKHRIQFYLDEFKKSISPYIAVRFEKLNEERCLINIRYNYSQFYLYCLEWYKDNLMVPEIEKLLNSIYSMSKKTSDASYILKVLHHRAVIEITSNRLKEAAKTCREGVSISREIGGKTEFYTFASMLIYIKIRISDYALKGKYGKIIRYYKNIKKEYPLNLWTLYLENSCSMTYYPEKREEILEIFKEQVCSNILIGDFPFSIYWRFMLDSEMYINKLSKYFKSEINGYPVHWTVDEKLLNEMDTLCINTLRYSRELNDIGFLWDIYLIRLKAYFFKEKNPDFDLALNIISKMDWLNKRRKKLKELETFRLLKLSFKMLENFDEKIHMTHSYLFKLEKMINEFKKNYEFEIIDYAILSGLGRRLKSEAVLDMVKEFYNWIIHYRPEIMEPVTKEINRTRDVDTK